MRKYITLIGLFILCLFSLNAQDLTNDIAKRVIDSTKKELQTAKGNKRIDCLNLLAECYYFIWDEDDKDLEIACSYSDEAYNLAKNSGYKRGLGYATLWKAQCIGGRVDQDINNNNSEPKYIETYNYANKAIKIGEEIKDYRLVGDVYDMLKWLERWKGDPAKFKANVEKAINYYEKVTTPKLIGLLNISKCDQCNGTENELGFLYTLLAGFPNTSIAIKEGYIQKAIAYYEKSGSMFGIGEGYLALGQSAGATMSIENGIEYFKRSISFYRKAPNEIGELKALIEICNSYWNLGDFENGLEYAKTMVLTAKKLIKYKEAGSADSLRLGQAYYWMGRFYAIAGDFETAFDYMWKARPYYPKFGNWLNPWTVAVGEFHRQVGAYDSAMFYLAPLEARNWGQPMISNLYVSLKQYDKALTLINEAIKQAKEGNFFWGLGRNYIIAAKAHFGKKDYETALTNARQGLALLSKLKRNTYVIEGYQTISEIFNLMKNNDSAYFYLKQYTILKDSLLNRQFFIRLNDYKKEAEELKKIGKINLLEKDNLIKAQQLQQQLLLQDQNETQLALLDKDNEIKEQQLQIKDKELKEQLLTRDRSQTQVRLLDKENKLKDQQLKQQSLIRNALLAGLFLLLALGIFIFRTLSLKRRNERLESEKRQAGLQQKASELEMQALRAQMNPHFIFNCLSSINKFILKNDTDIASDYLTRFSRLIRQTLTNSQLSLIPLSDEIEMLRLYLDMERLRFSDSFRYNITYENSIEPETVYVPPMLLQPFCENAIWHGLMHKDGEGKLEVVLSLEDGHLRCIIADNGIGRAKAAELKSGSNGKQKSLGLKITKERLAIFNNERSVHEFYKTEDVLDANGNVAGTKVALTIRIKNPAHEPAKQTV